MMLSRLKKPDEITGTNQEKMTDAEQIINMVNKAVTSISNRLTSLAHFEGTDSKVCCNKIWKVFILFHLI